MEGKKPTLWSSVLGLVEPISIQNFVQNVAGEDKDGSVAAVAGSFLDILGLGTNTYDAQARYKAKTKTPEEVATMTDKQKVKYDEGLAKPPFVKMVEGVPFDSALKIYDKASPEQRASIAAIVQNKLVNAWKKDPTAIQGNAALAELVRKFAADRNGVGQ
jgi:hypothetical protein